MPVHGLRLLRLARLLAEKERQVVLGHQRLRVRGPQRGLLHLDQLRMHLRMRQSTARLVRVDERDDRLGHRRR